jgi:toxin ParE1/3/4
MPFSNRLTLATQHVEDFERIGRVVPELKNPRLRELIIDDYRLVYLTDPPVVRVITVRHGRMNLPSHLRRLGYQ